MRFIPIVCACLGIWIIFKALVLDFIRREGHWRDWPRA